MNKDALEKFNKEHQPFEPTQYFDALVNELEMEAEKLELNRPGHISPLPSQRAALQEMARVNGQLDIVKAIQKVIAKE